MPKECTNFWESIERDDKYKKKIDKEFNRDIISEQMVCERMQAQRVISVMDEIIQKTRIAICLHELFSHRAALVRQVLSGNDWKYIKANYDLGETGSFSIIDLNVALFQKDEYTAFLLREGEKPKVSPTMLRVIHILSKYPKIEEIANILIEKNKMRQSATWLYLQTLEELRNKIVEEIQIPADEKIKNYRYLRRVYIAQSAFVQKLTGLRSEVTAERNRLNAEVERKAQIMFMGSLRLPSLKNETKQKLSQHIRYSECEMVLKSREHEELVGNLANLNRQTFAAYEDTLEENLVTENKIKSQRMKLEMHLNGFIKQYDKEIGGRQEVLDEITTTIEDYERRLAEKWEEYHSIEKDYDECVADRERLYQAELTKKAMLFNQERCVRIIQTAWRKVLEIRHQRKTQKYRKSEYGI